MQQQTKYVERIYIRGTGIINMNDYGMKADDIMKDDQGQSNIMHPVTRNKHTTSPAYVYRTTTI